VVLPGIQVARAEILPAVPLVAEVATLRPARAAEVRATMGATEARAAMVRGCLAGRGRGVCWNEVRSAEQTRLALGQSSYLISDWSARHVAGHVPCGRSGPGFCRLFGRAHRSYNLSHEHSRVCPVKQP